MSRAIGSGSGQANPATYYDAGQQLCVVLEPADCGQYLTLLQMPFTTEDECPADVQEWLQAVILSGYLNGKACVSQFAMMFMLHSMLGRD